MNQPPGPFGGGASPFAPSSSPFGAPGGQFMQRPQSFASPPSSAPASSSLYQRPADALHLPDLLGFIQVWHKGKTQHDSLGKPTLLAWHALEVIHLDTATVVYVHHCAPSEEDKDVAMLIQQRIEHRARGMGDGSMQRFEVRCHFRSEDGKLTAWEPYTTPVTLPPAIPHWGQPHYGGMGGGGGVSSWGGPGSAGGYGGGGGGFGGPNAFAQSLHRGYLDATQMAHNVLFRALDMTENHCRRLEAANARHEAREMERMALMDQLQNTAQTRKLQEQMAELKMAAIQTALQKFLTSVPLGLVVLNRWLNGKKEEKSGKVTARETRAWDTLRKISTELQKNPMLAENPQIVRGMLSQAGVTEETLDDTFKIFQEFAFDKMIEDAEVNTKKELLGMGEESDGNDGLRRLLKAAGMAKEPDVANDGSAQEKAG